MTFERSHYYARTLGATASRLDALYHDPAFDETARRIEASRIAYRPLRDLVTLGQESRDPRENPAEPFLYVDIGSVDVVRGLAEPSELLGSEATSSRMRRVIRTDDVLVSGTRPTRGAICLVMPEWDGQVCTTGFAVLRCKPDILPAFLYNALRTPLVAEQLERACTGSGYPAVNIEVDLLDVRIPFVPGLERQQAIVDAVEAERSRARRLDAEAEEKRQAADILFVRELGLEVQPMNFGHKTGRQETSSWFAAAYADLPDRMHFLWPNPKHDLIAELRARLEVTTIDRVVSVPIKTGKQPEFDETGDCIALKTVDLKNDWIDYAGALRVRTEFFDSQPQAQVEPNDIIVAATGYVSMGKVDIHTEQRPTMISGELLAIRTNDSYSPDFLSYVLRSSIGQVQFERWFSGSSGQIHLYDTDLAHFSVPAPTPAGIPRDRQDAVVREVKPMMVEARATEVAAEGLWKALHEVFLDAAGV